MMASAARAESRERPPHPRSASRPRKLAPVQGGVSTVNDQLTDGASCCRRLLHPMDAEAVAKQKVVQGRMEAEQGVAVEGVVFRVSFGADT
jgi:hypothetical protein